MTIPAGVPYTAKRIVPFSVESHTSSRPFSVSPHRLTFDNVNNSVVMCIDETRRGGLVLRHIFIFVYEVIRQMARFTPTKEDHMAAKYVLKLAEEERQYLSEIAKGRRGKQAIAQWKVTRAKALLKCDQGELGPAWGDRHIADALDVTERSIQNWRKRAVLDGPETALVRKLRSAPPVTPKVDGRVEAHLTKLACSTPPKGRNRWTLRLLAEKVVELELVDSLSHETVRRTLKKTL